MAQLTGADDGTVAVAPFVVRAEHSVGADGSAFSVVSGGSTGEQRQPATSPMPHTRAGVTALRA